MHEALAPDVSTLASLSPAQPRETHYHAYKTSPRLGGSHFMTLKRPSRLPESGREYVPGDPVNMIDWKAYGRTDQLIVREVRDEAAARVAIALDVSATMQWPTAAVPAAAKATKAEVAARVALHLAYLHLRMGDHVEICLVAADREQAPTHLLKPRGPADVLGVFARLVAAGFTADACLAEFSPEAASPRPRDCVFWIGDGLGDGDFDAFLALGRRACLMHVLSSLELRIDWLDDTTSYFDEGGEPREYQGQILRQPANYLASLARWRGQLETRLGKAGAAYVTLSDATPIGLYLKALATLGQAAGR